MATVRDTTDHEATKTSEHVLNDIRRGYATPRQMVKIRNKSERQQRLERQRGVGPPYVRDGRLVLYSIPGYLQYLEANTRLPVHERGAANNTARRRRVSEDIITA